MAEEGSILGRDRAGRIRWCVGVRHGAYLVIGVLTCAAVVRTGSKILEIRNATVFRGETRVFDGLDLEIEEGRSTVVLGPNGAGKTTLLRLITRDLYCVVREGSWVRVLGRERWNVFELRDRLGIVSPELQVRFERRISGRDVVLSGFFSSVGLYRHQTVTASQRVRADQVIRSLRIDSLAERSFATLSAGEQRRFLLARALVHDPQSLILDEPTTGLDPQGAFGFLSIVRGLAREGKTLILVTHHLHEIPPEVEHVVLLKEGRVFAEGEKAEILSSEVLSELFGTSLELVEKDGHYRVLPC
jgi:iron complex transport system ATP-binding protein